MKPRHHLTASAILLSVLAFASCKDAIYATIENEKKVSTNTLSSTLDVFSIAIPAAGNYYVAAGAIFQGILNTAIDTVTWTPNADHNTRPWNPSNLICTSLAYFGGNLYGGFFDSSGTPYLYKDDGTYNFSGTHGTLMTMAASGEQVTGLFGKPSPTLLMGGATAPVSEFVYELDYFNGSAWLQTNLTNLPKKISGMGWDGTAYWAASGSTLYKSTALPTFNAVTGLTPTPDLIQGIYVDPANAGRVFVMTKTDGVYYTSNGGVKWDNPSDQVGQTTVGFLSAAGPVDSPTGVVYLIGSDGYGYYTLNISTGSFERFSDSTIALYSASVSVIAVDGVNVVIGTNGKGVWRGVFNSLGEIADTWINE